jgi:hypothetical protein
LISGFSEVLSYEEITIHYEAGDVKIAKQIAPPFYRNIVRFQKEIGLYTVLPVTVQLLEKEEIRYKENSIIEFSNAFYSFKEKTIFVKNPKQASRYARLQEILLHEYIHHFIYNHYPNAPLWFHEGMAVYFTEGITYQRKIHFIKDKVIRNSLPLKEMTNMYPESSIRWQSFYSKSALAIQYLLTYHKEAFYHFWDYAAKTNNFNQAFLNSFFMTQEQFSNHFETYANEHFRIELLLGSSTILWALFPLLFFVGIWRRKKQAKEIEKHWEEQE